MLRHVDLCSGIGGFSLGFEWAGLSAPVLFCDIDKWCRKVLTKHWPAVPVVEDVKELASDPERLVPDCDILTAGYPCQPFSVAGKQKGTKDDRHIWPYLRQIIAQKRPTWCVFENVYGHIALGLDQVLLDLESEGYSTRTFIVPACGVDAPHRRDRLWIVAHTTRSGSQARGGDGMGDEHGSSRNQGQLEGGSSEEPRADVVGNSENHGCEGGSEANGREGAAYQQDEPRSEIRSELIGSSATMAHTQGEFWDERQHGFNSQEIGQEGLRGEVGTSGSTMAHTDSKRGRGGNTEWENATSTRQSPCNQRDNARGMGTWHSEPSVGRVANGVSGRVDRLKGLGNAIVPQIAYQIGLTIKAAEND